MNFASILFNEPFLVRGVCRVAARRLKIGSYSFRLGIGAVVRPHYGFLVYQAARLAARLGQPRVSILEFGVAGGAGILALEYHAEQVEKLFPVKIEIYGFDTGKGLPDAHDYRDMPYIYKPGFYEMNVPALKARLKRAKLVLGNVSDTVNGFFKEYNPAPVGAVAHDMDFYSSTMAAFKLLDAGCAHFLPRIFCYFDDTIGRETELFGDFTGQRLAIHDFNESHAKVKLTPIYYLRVNPAARQWYHQMWSLHFFDHTDYSTFIGDENSQLPI
jgi:hypothetical protein